MEGQGNSYEFSIWFGVIKPKTKKTKKPKKSKKSKEKSVVFFSFSKKNKHNHVHQP